MSGTVLEKIGQLLRRLLDQRDGAAAVEFALIVPFLLALYTGGVELIVGIMIDRQVTLVASTVANITAQYTTISASTQMPDILNASSQILAPYPVSSATVVVSCISIDASGNATVAWSKALNTTARTAGSAITIPSSLATPNSSIVLGETTYRYTPFADLIHLGTITLRGTTYMVPRAATAINLTS